MHTTYSMPEDPAITRNVHGTIVDFWIPEPTTHEMWDRVMTAVREIPDHGNDVNTVMTLAEMIGMDRCSWCMIGNNHGEITIKRGS